MSVIVFARNNKRQMTSLLDDCYKDKIKFICKHCYFAYISAQSRKKNFSPSVDFYKFTIEILT